MNATTRITDRSTARPGPARRPGTVGGVVVLLMGAIQIAGCTGALNRENGLIGVPDGGCPDLHGPVATGAADAADATGAGAVGSAERIPLTGLDRRAWPVIVVEAPAGQVEHQPTYFESLPLATGTARGRGDAPTTSTVLEGASDGGSLLAEAAAAPFVFAGELIISPVRMIVQPPWSTLRSPARHPAQAVVPDGGTATQWRWVEPAP